SRAECKSAFCASSQGEFSYVAFVSRLLSFCRLLSQGLLLLFFLRSFFSCRSVSVPYE
ncbi:hypothetical protein L9F63_000693, partial [Diploptera punctata]